MADDSAADTFGKIVLGAGVGFGLYLLIRGAGFGGIGVREGRGGDGRSAPSTSSAPSRPKDLARLSFVMTAPTEPAKPAVFQLTGDSSRTYTLEQLIARVKEGGRNDVALKIRGDVIESAAIAARSRIRQTGLDLALAESPRVSGRGYYGRTA